MSFTINTYDEHNPCMQIDVGNRRIEFSVANVKPESREWLGGVLDRQINEMVDLRVRQALEAHKEKLRELIGVRP